MHLFEQLGAIVMSTTVAGADAILLAMWLVHLTRGRRESRSCDDPRLARAPWTSGASRCRFGQTPGNTVAPMRDADVALNIASTTSLDAIAADTLVVNIGFNALPTPPDSTHARYYGLPSQGDRGERGLLASRDRQQNCGCS